MQKQPASIVLTCAPSAAPVDDVRMVLCWWGCVDGVLLMMLWRWCCVDAGVVDGVDGDGLMVFVLMVCCWW